MSEYVDRQAVINAVLSRYSPGMSGTKSEVLREIMENVPAADVVSVIHAHWQYSNYDPGECSHCGLAWDENMKNNGEDWGEWDPVPAYCPNCGAKMDA